MMSNKEAKQAYAKWLKDVPLADYVESQERVPKHERREPDASVLICITMFGVFGMVVGALVTWLVMA